MDKMRDKMQIKYENKMWINWTKSGDLGQNLGYDNVRHSYES